MRGGGLVGNLPIWQKLLLIAGAFTLPIIVAVGLLIGEQNVRINFALRELVGVAYLRPVSTIQQLFEDYVLLAVSAAQGDINARQQLSVTVEAIDAAFDELEAVDRLNNRVLGVSDDILRFRQDWNVVKTQLNTNILQLTEIGMTLLNERVLPLYRNIADNSNLSLDPEVSTSYLMLAATQELPKAISSVGAFRTVGRTVIIDGSISGAERFVVTTSYANALNASNEVFGSLDRALAASPFVREQLAQSQQAARAAVFELIDAYETNIINVTQPTFTFEQASALTNPRPLLYTLLDDVLGTLEQMLVSRVQGLQQAQLISLVLLALALALTFALVGIVTRRIVSPIIKLSSASQKLAAGDLNTFVDVESSDEMGQLGMVFNEAIVQLREASNRQLSEIERGQQLQGNISEFLNVAMDIAGGDLTKRGVVTEDVLGNVIDAINLMVEEVSYLLKGVRDTASSVTEGAQTMLNTTALIDQSTSQQAAAAQRVAGDVAQVVGAMRTVAQSATDSAAASTQALAASEKGQAAVTNTLSGMQNIRREVQTIAKRLKTLGDRSLEISEIVDTISGIAKQTNLLALNAAVEASGAGEAGKRFAIVANEVRKLAKDAAAATGRIEAQISSVQAEVQEVIQSVEDGTREVELGYRVATEAGERLKEIGDISRRAALLAQTIAQDTQIQSQGVEQVGQTITEVASIAERSRQDVAAGRSAAEALQGLSKQLSESLSRFKLEGA
jgi:twitching motility protein PilJ